MSSDSQRYLARSRKSESKLGLDIKKLDSKRTLQRVSKPRKSLTQSPPDSHPVARGSSNALHMGRAACLVPEHDDLHKKVEKIKEALVREREKTKEIRDEFDAKESSLLMEVAQLRNENRVLLVKQADEAKEHSRHLQMIEDKQRELTKQTEIAHQKELREMYQRHEDQIVDKNRSIDLLKAQVERLMSGQSKERQNQIDEMRKKLMGAAREANELRTEIMKLRKSDFPTHFSREKESSPAPGNNGSQLIMRVGICMNCVVLQQALSATHKALKVKMAELSRVDRTAASIRVGLELNDIALAALEKRDEEK